MTDASAEVGPICVRAIDENVWLVSAHADAASALLSVDGFWSGPDADIFGDEPAVLATKSALVVADSQDVLGVRFLQLWAEERRGSPDFVSAEILVRRDGVWCVFEP